MKSYFCTEKRKIFGNFGNILSLDRLFSKVSKLIDNTRIRYFTKTIYETVLFCEFIETNSVIYRINDRTMLKFRLESEQIFFPNKIFWKWHKFFFNSRHFWYVWLWYQIKNCEMIQKKRCIDKKGTHRLRYLNL